VTTEERATLYPLGCAVVATAKYRAQFPRARSRGAGTDITGRVVGYGRHPDRVCVLVDGHLTKRSFHWHFWDRIV